ncbi:M56 family metallopeptidase [Pedobacter nyackensis]|uniref:M56 family metallopeptidase n=1 Tax=Pedobacter nyackensis TaxID=475255 RepID=UPI00292EE268|nr:M56 family metallopeptidase [Pedobacter nyackensis]
MEPLLNNLIKAIGWSIFHSLWQGAIIYGILLLIAIAVPKLQSRLKHNLAFAAICLIFICYCVTFFSVFKLPAATAGMGSATVNVATQYYQYVNSLPQQISGKAEYLFPYLVGIYGIGLALQLLLLGMGYKRILQIKKAARLEVPSEWKASFNKLLFQLNLRQHITFYLSDKINVPLVIGYFKPVVLFPISLASQLDMDQVEAILIHELSHIRRNDYLLNMIKTGIETLLFFNPFIWLSGKFINIEREHACDDLVLKFTGNPMTYAHALLKLEILKDKSTPAFSMAATGKSQHLYQRIKRITDMKTNYMNVRQQMFVITLAIATVISMAWVKPSKAEKTGQKINRQKHTEITVVNTKQDWTPTQAPAPPAAPVIDCPVLTDIPEPLNPPAPAMVAVPTPLDNPLLHLYQDTTKKKLKYTIITVDEKGNKKEYQSVKDMPESMRNEVIKETFSHTGDFSKDLNIYIDTIVNNSLAFLKSPEWKKSIAEATASADKANQYFNSKEWKKQQEDIRKNAESIGNYFNSKEWKKQQEDIRKNAESIGNYFNSKEWKKQQEELRKSAEEAYKQALKADEAARKMKQKEAKEKNTQWN